MLQGKTCIVVGGAKGTGSHLVEQYAKKGYTVAFMDIDKESSCSLKDKVETEYGGNIFFFHGDANSEEDIELFAGAIIGQYKKIDCLYYRTDIAESANLIAELLYGYLKRDGMIMSYS
ncbi:SDR family NAD(P)-dependent oxidoreductase [Kineothrix sp. MB12-C1]|uniref:SDR family NAD(P)-dependent oxidoreductase n=1 Tax=Kineothrix sp. MB12-C1 TaxID=3070215 RepID=UPI0027D23574|nr:SDR family NAD(P)-dependent oxidoreductase [Kineothrix sp. MB12-C1]WMC92029.1 SDR family NAD(P)-dependent oxidoreductase [Kineothrix sp. MB12-C1]